MKHSAERSYGWQRGRRYSGNQFGVMAPKIEESLYGRREKESLQRKELPEIERTGIVHDCGAIAKIIAHYKSQQPPIHVDKHYFTAPRLEFVGPHYVVQRVCLLISPFWDQFGESSFAHNNFIRQTLLEGIDYSEIKWLGYLEGGALTEGRIIFEEKVGKVAKTMGKPLVLLEDHEEFDWYLEKLVAEVNGRPDGIYEARRVLEIKYNSRTPIFYSGWENQQSVRNFGKVARTKKERNFWSSTVSDKKLAKILASGE